MTGLFGAVQVQTRVEAAQVSVGAEAAIGRAFAEPGAFVLESSGPDRDDARFTILGFNPVFVFDDAVAARFSGGAVEKLTTLDAFAAAVRSGPGGRPTADLPFVGGWVGYIAYEAGLSLENLPCSAPDESGLPLVRFALYDTVAVLDRLREQWYVAGVEWPDGADIVRPSLAVRLDCLRELLADAGRCPPPEPRRVFSASLEPNVTRDQYLRVVRRGKEYIAAGDIYQVNLTQRFRTHTDATPLDIYRRLRRVNPSAYAALLRWGARAVISASPELFLDVRGGGVITRPIKGTRPRIGDAVVDARNRDELLASEKDRAELTMIVDLLRNDLGRVCEYGSVRVRAAADLEVHPTVFHLVGTVEGRLRPGCDGLDLLRASFPGGSITGAPKVRAMQIIDELEPTRRGPYCGSVGYIGLDGSMCLNIAIRTMVYDRGRLDMFAGGGIVADSDPEAEYEETLAKAAGMMRAIGHDSARFSRQRQAEATP